MLKFARKLAIIGTVTLSSAFSVACAADLTAPPSSERQSADQFIKDNHAHEDGAADEDDHEGFIKPEGMTVPADQDPRFARRIDVPFIANPNDDPDYAIAWKSMAEIYKGTLYDQSQKNPANPPIGLGNADLNKDDLPEIVAVPIQTFDEQHANIICKSDGYACPFHIIQKRDSGAHTLGVIWASSLALGDEIKNGYWTVKAIRFEKSGSKVLGPFFDDYQYDKKKDAYVKTQARKP